MMIHWRLCHVPDAGDMKEARTRLALSSRHEVIWVSRCLPHTGIPSVMKVVTHWYWNHRAEHGIWNKVWVGRWAGTRQAQRWGSSRLKEHHVRRKRCTKWPHRCREWWEIGWGGSLVFQAAVAKNEAKRFVDHEMLCQVVSNGSHWGGWGICSGNDRVVIAFGKCPTGGGVGSVGCRLMG